MKLPLFCCALLTMAGAAFGQDSAGTPPPLPSGPLLKRAPDMSTWTVTSQNGATPKDGQNQDSGTVNQSKPFGFRQVVVTKTGKIIDEQLVDGMGRNFDIWHDNGIEVNVPPGAAAPLILPDTAAKDIYITNFAVSDFAGLDWVSSKTYAGIQKVMGQDCIIFRGKVNPLPADVQGEVNVRAERGRLMALKINADAKIAQPGKSGASKAPIGMKSPDAPGEVDAVACIDLETRLPVVVTFGQETRTYVFGQPPTSPQELPAAYAAAVVAYQRHIANLSRASAAP